MCTVSSNVLEGLDRIRLWKVNLLSSGARALAFALRYWSSPRFQAFSCEDFTVLACVGIYDQETQFP